MTSIEIGDEQYSWLIAGSSAAVQYMRTLNSSWEITPTMIIGISAALWTLIKVVAQVSLRRLLTDEGDRNKTVALADRLVGFSHACAIMFTEDTSLCIPSPMHWSVVLLNVAFNTLNAFWGAKVIQQLVPSKSLKEKKVS
ncbi:hypothetical protein CYMTET_16807 [Cymbomonas tetramitiformis]|uniref:Uncharacterized protein n=1 Tax=Cymbomonas tetramitiformis TaxID=36881 RepID=A0AAE0GCP0_9CHLO|nr:hypothetical protein CYMTET_16807 [Cymbomonas tetramitiformis]